MISTYLIAMALKVLLLALPLSVALLALRRLLASQSANAWLYGASLLYALVTATGVLPWALNLAQAAGLFLSLSALSPVVWLIVVVLCDRERMNRYDNSPLVRPRVEAPATLVLTDPVLPPVPMFRHSRPGGLVGSAAPRATDVAPAPARRTAPKVERPAARGVLAVARAMRGQAFDEADTPRGTARVDGAADLPFLVRAPG